MQGVNHSMVIGPVNYSGCGDEKTRLQKFLDATFEFVAGRSNEHIIDGEQCFSLFVREEADYFVLAHNHDPNVESYQAEEIAGIMRHAFWRPRHIETVISHEGLIANLEQ